VSHPACLPPAPGEAAPRYEAYLTLCPAGDVRHALEEQRLELLETFGGLGEEEGALAYAHGKWSVAQLLGHLADAEQLFLERALRAARGDAAPQPAWEEDDYAAAWRPRLEPALARLLEQRRLGAAFFAELPGEAWTRPGSVEGRAYTPRVLARLLVGHAAHHLGVFRERYLPLLPHWRPRRLEARAAPGLLLRQAELGDLGELLTLARAERARLAPWLGWAAGEIAAADTRAFLLAARELWLRRGLPTLALRTEAGLAGMCGLHPVDGRCAHIGYWLAAAAEGRGLARAAARWLTRHAFEELGLERVEIRCAVENRRSRGVPEALGFRLEGVMRGAQRLPAGVLDLALYAVTAADWPVLREAWERTDLG
jgi:ribosomal-protein-serine acetyltransferase